MASLVSVNVGMPKDVQWNGKTVHTGIWKTPVEGSVMVRRLNIDGDGQGDLAGHGGEQRAVMVYQTESYDYWKTHLRCPICWSPIAVPASTSGSSPRALFRLGT